MLAAMTLFANHPISRGFAALGLFAVATLLGACRSPKPPIVPLEERMAELERPYQQLAAQKAELWRAGHEQQDFVFPEAGTVRVLRWELAGWPGQVYVKARVHYLNTTEIPRSEAFVWLDVIGADGNVAGGTAARLVSPMGYPFWPGHGYVAELRAPTNGAHLAAEGFSWAVQCEAPIETEPGVEPVIINHRLEQERAILPPPTQRASTQVRGPAFGPHVPGQTRW